MKANTTSPSHGALDAAERPKVAVPLAAEFAIVSTLVLIAAPVVLVGVTAMRALMKSRERARAERAVSLTPRCGELRSTVRAAHLGARKG
jgi:hypothetical protein